VDLLTALGKSVLNILAVVGGVIMVGAYLAVAFLVATSSTADLYLIPEVAAIVFLAAIHVVGVSTFVAPGWAAGQMERYPRIARPIAFAYLTGRLGVSMATVVLTIAASVVGYIWLRSAPLSQGWLVTIVVLATAIAGAVLFAFRLYARALYGSTEAIVGLLIAGQRAAVETRWPIEDLSFDLAVLTAGVYLVVRGLDNVHQALKKEPRRNVKGHAMPQILGGGRESEGTAMGASRKD